MTRSVPTRPHLGRARPRRAPLRRVLCRGAGLARLAALGALAGAALLTAPVAPARAQGFGPAIRVNDKVITSYELDQRTRMLQIFGTPGDPREEAREQLIEERLKMGAADRFGLTADPAQVEAGMAEFAARADMEPDQFVAALTAEGVAEQTFRTFVTTNVVWRQVVRGMFASKVNVTEDEVDRAIASQGRQGGVEVRMAEIFIPTRQNPEMAADLARRISQITDPGAFAQAARDYSAAPSREEDGQLGWMGISNLPPALQPVIMGLKPGEVTQPLEVNGALALFQLRGVRETAAAQPDYLAIDFARYFIPGGRSDAALAEAARIRAEIDTCDDLYGVAQGQPPERLDRVSLAPAEIPRDEAIELAKLDENEVSTALTRRDGQMLEFLMLCGRTPEGAAGDGEVDRAQVLQQLQNRRLGSYADGYLAQLRSEARIVE